MPEKMQLNPEYLVCLSVVDGETINVRSSIHNRKLGKSRHAQEQLQETNTKHILKVIIKTALLLKSYSFSDLESI